jgi:hypothetical protein
MGSIARMLSHTGCLHICYRIIPRHITQIVVVSHTNSKLFGVLDSKQTILLRIDYCFTSRDRTLRLRNDRNEWMSEIVLEFLRSVTLARRKTWADGWQ